MVHREARPSLHVIPATIERNLGVFLPSWRGAETTLALGGLPPGTRYVEVRTTNGRWLASLALEANFAPNIYVPKDIELMLKADDAWFSVVSRGQPLRLNPLSAPGFAARDATTDRALQQGLFRAPFGPAFFGGFLAAGGIAPLVPQSVPAASSLPIASTVLWAVSGVAAIGALTLGALATVSWVEFGTTDLQVPARDALARSVWLTSGAALTGGAAVLGVGAGAVFLDE